MAILVLYPSIAMLFIIKFIAGTWKISPPEIKKKHSRVLYLKVIYHHDFLLVDSDDDLAVCHAQCA